MIGAGWAGLAAAVKLASQGTRVTVFEASRHLGGRARRVSLNEGDAGIDLDNGQHILIGAYGDTLALMRLAGADPDRLLLRLPLQLRYADGFHLRAPRLPAPLHLAAALFGAEGLGFGEAVSAARFMRALKSTQFRIAPDRSVSQLLAEHGQTGALRSHVWEPLCVSALNTPPDAASAQVFANVLRDALTGARAHSDLLIPRADLGELFPEPAARYVQAHGGTVLPGTPVRRVDYDAGGYAVDDRPERYRQVIVAVAPQHAGALLEPMVARCPALDVTRTQLARIDYEPIVTCYLQYPPSVTLDAPMLGFTGGIVQWAFDRGVIASAPFSTQDGSHARAPQNSHAGLIAVVISASGTHQTLDNEALAARVHKEILPFLQRVAPITHAARVTPGQSESVQVAPLWSRVIHEKRATFSCTPALNRPEGVTPLPGLHLAGDYVASDYPATLEAAVRSGIAAARGVSVAG